MKKVITAATTAAMTLSMLAVPAVICSAADTTGIIIKDTAIEVGKDTFAVDIVATESGSISDSVLGLVADMQFGGTYKAVIEDVKGEAGLTAKYADGKVTFSGSADVKRGDTVATVTVKLYDSNNNKATTIPANTTFVLNVTEATGSFAGIDKDAASACLYVEKAGTANAGAKFELGSVNVFDKTKTVTVPVKLSGSYMAVNTRFRVSGGAKIKEITDLAEGFELSTDKTGILFAPKASKMEDTSFSDATVANIVIELPADAVSGQSFEVSARFFDGSNKDKVAVKPEVVNSDIIYVMFGDTNLNNKVDLFDATYVQKELLFNSDEEEYLPTLFENVQKTNDYVAETIANVTMDKLKAAVKEAVDVSANGKVDLFDSTYIKKYLLYISSEELTPEECPIAKYMAENKK